MKKTFRPFAAFMLLAFAILACSSSFEVVGTQPPPTEQSTTLPAAPVVFERLLPHTFYYLADGQVFRMEHDGKTVTQLTFEPVDVTDYDVSPVDGSVAYVASNQLLLVDADGSNRRMLVDGGTSPDLHGSYNPVFSPDGRTLAYARNGLNLYDLSAGIPSLVLEDLPLGGALPPEIYAPEKYSPDGAKLLLKVGHPPDSPWTGAIYSPATKVLQQFAGDEESTTCCTQYGGAEWSADSSSFYAVASTPDASFPFGELWRVDAVTGGVTTLIPGSAGEGAVNLPYKPYLAPDGNLYFFYNTALNPDGVASRTPLQIVRTAPDGVTGLAVLRPDTFELMNEALWAPDASFVVVAFAPTEEVYDGGRAEIVYLDGRPNVVLTTFAQQMKWGQ